MKLSTMELGLIREIAFSLLLTFIYICALALFVIGCLPIYAFRFLVSQLKRWWRPDLSHLVHSRSIVLAIDGFPSDPKWNLVVWLSQDGILNLDNFREYFESKFVRDKDPTGKFYYPEYSQYIEKWLGFHFWAWDLDFNIQNHIRTYSDESEVVDDTKLLQIIKELTRSPWHPRRSPWEFLQIPNYSGKNSNLGAKSVLIFRLHHVLGDGYFILRLLMEDISGISLEKAAQPSAGIQKSLLIRRLLAAPSNFMKMILRGKNEHQWHLSSSKIPNAALSPRIAIKDLKTIRDFYGVSLTAVINAAVTGGMRRMMIQNGVIPPKEIHQTVPVPMRGHPRKLCNHFIFSFISLPIGTEDPVARLLQIEEKLQFLKTSFVPLLTFWKVPLVGSIFPCLMSPFTTNNFTTCLMSNFPGTPEVPQFREVKVVDMMFGAGLGPGSTGIGFTLISYVGFIRLLSVVDPGILPTDASVEELNQKIIQELDILHQLAESEQKKLINRQV